MTLDEIKDEVAKEQGSTSFESFYKKSDKEALHGLMKEVCKRYAFEVAKASLLKASGNATMEVRGRMCTKGMTYANHRMEDHTVFITQSSITDESNIVL